MDYQLRNSPFTLRLRTLRNRVACFLSLFLFLLAASSASATPINYGDFTGTSVEYTDVTESSGTDPVPLYGAPTIGGNTLDFEPVGFVATSGGGVDVTDGQLNYRVESVPGTALESIDIVEGGDYSLAGGGSASVTYGIAVRVTVQAIDGIDIPIVDQFDLFKSDSETLSLPGDAGILQPWDFSLSFDLDDALTAAGKAFDFGVTKAEVSIDDQLVAIAQPGNFAFIAKKNFTNDIPTDPIDPNIVPEPTTLVLAGFGLVGLIVRRKAS